MKLTLESFKNIARMQDAQMQDQGIRIKKDKHGGESCMVAVKNTTTSAAENRAVRERFIDVLSSDRRFSKFRTEIKNLLTGERGEVEVSDKPLTARTITTVLHTLTQKAGFRGLLADDHIKGSLSSVEHKGEVADGWMVVDSKTKAFSDNDIELLLRTIPAQVQKDYADAYRGALFDDNGALRAEPDYEVLEILKDRLTSRLATVQDHALYGGMICADLKNITNEDQMNEKVENLVTTWVKNKSWLADGAESTALLNPKSVDGKILRAEMKRFIMANLDTARKMGSNGGLPEVTLLKQEGVYGNLMDAIARAERSISAFRALEKELPKVVGDGSTGMSKKYDLDEKRVNTLQAFATKLFEGTLSDFTALVSKINVTEDEIDAFMRPDGHSLSYKLEQKIEEEAHRLTMTDEEIATKLSSEIATYLMGDKGEAFLADFTADVRNAFGADVNTSNFLSANEDTGVPFLFEDMVKSIHDDLKETLGKSKTLSVDELRATVIGNVRQKLDMMRIRAGQMRDAVRLGMYEAFGETADKLFAKIGPDLTQDQRALRSKFMAKLSRLPNVREELSRQACRFLSNPLALDLFRGAKPMITAGLEKVLALTLDEVIQNHSKMMKLIHAATEKVTAFLAENPTGEKIRMANDQAPRLVRQQRELREKMKELIANELAFNLQEPGDYDFTARGAAILTGLNEMVDAFREENTRAYLEIVKKENEEKERLAAEEKKFRDEAMKAPEEEMTIKKESTIRKKDVEDVRDEAEVDEVEEKKDIAPSKGTMTWEEMAVDFMLKKERLEDYIKGLAGGHSSSEEDEVSLFEWSHDQPMHSEFKMSLEGTLRRFMRNMLNGEETRIRLQQPKTVGEQSTKRFEPFDEEKMKTRIRESAMQFWKAITEQVPLFVKTLGEELKSRGVNVAALDLEGARKYGKGNLPPNTPLARDIFALGKKYIVDVLVQGLMEGEPQPDFAKDVKLLLGGEDGYLAKLLAAEEKESARILETTFNDTTSWLITDMGDGYNGTSDEIKEILQGYADELRTTEPALSPREISKKVKEVADQFRTFRENLEQEFDKRLMNKGVALPPGRKDLDDALLSSTVTIRRAKTLAEKVKLFRELVGSQSVDNIVSSIMDGLESSLDSWRAQKTDPNNQKVFLNDRLKTQWATGRFIGLLKPNAKTGVPSKKQIAEAEKAFKEQSELIRQSIANVLSSNVHMKYADLLSKNVSVTNERLEQVVFEEERAILPHIVNINRVLASCAKVLTKKGVIGKNAPYASIADLLSDRKSAYLPAIANEVERMLRSPGEYKSNFSFFGDTTTNTFTDDVRKIQKNNG